MLNTISKVKSLKYYQLATYILNFSFQKKVIILTKFLLSVVKQFTNSI